MSRYPNGQIPEHELIIFNRGRTIHRLNDGSTLVEDWYQGLTPGTYQKHLALVNRTGGRLQLTRGFSCYRPLYGQAIARKLYGNGAARVGTSSHGGVWEGRDTLAMDYANWYAVFGSRDAFYAACRAVGLEPGLISEERGYPDEPWHVIDGQPWRAVAGGAGGGATPFPIPEPEPIKEDDMPGIRFHFQKFTNGNQAYVVETETGFFIPDDSHRAALVKAYGVDLSKLEPLNEYDWNAVQQAKNYNNSGYPQPVESGFTDAMVQTLATETASAVAAKIADLDVPALAAELEQAIASKFVNRLEE